VGRFLRSCPTIPKVILGSDSCPKRVKTASKVGHYHLFALFDRFDRFRTTVGPMYNFRKYAGGPPRQSLKLYLGPIHVQSGSKQGVHTEKVTKGIVANFGGRFDPLWTRIGPKYNFRDCRAWSQESTHRRAALSYDHSDCSGPPRRSVPEPATVATVIA